MIAKNAAILLFELEEPSESKVWSWVLWGSEPRIAVLARTRSNLAVSQTVSLHLEI
jgi:hypothetical protein